MPGKQAKILSPEDTEALLWFADRTRQPIRNRALVLLSVKAGLRAAEIAALTWDMVSDATGSIAPVLELQNRAAKNGRGRRIPMHPELQAALFTLRHQNIEMPYVLRSERGGPLSPLSVVVWFYRAFQAIGLVGCSSHSGRRTFITRAARLVHRAGGSLRDVQILAGHSSLLTTQRYIDGDTDVQRQLVTML